MTRIALLALLLTLAGVSPALAGEDWTSDFKAALAQAKQAKRPLLLDFTGSDWCRPCIALHREVFAGQDFQTLAKGLVLVELDFPQRTEQPKELAAQNAQLKERYKIKGFPSAILIDFEGTEIGRISGYEPGKGAGWLAEFKGLIAAGFAPETGLAKPKPQGGPDGSLGTWTTRWETAQASARRLKRPILVNFTGSDWCGWCKQLHAEVFATAAFQEWASARVILLELDFPARTPQPSELKEQNARLAQQYKVEGFPTVLFLDAEGKRLGESGYLPGGPQGWVVPAK